MSTNDYPPGGVLAELAGVEQGRALRIDVTGGGSWDPVLSQLTIPAGTGGTVTSVALSMPAEFSVSGSPVTGTGTLAVSKATQSANLVYAGPASGGAAVPAFRALAIGDFADSLITNAKLANSSLTVSGSGGVSASGGGPVALGGTVSLSFDLTYAAAWTAAHTHTLAVAAAQTAGLSLLNTTAATSGNQKYSPALYFEGRGHTGSTSQTVSAYMQLQPVQATNATADLSFYLRNGSQSDPGTIRMHLTETHPSAAFGSVPGRAVLYLSGATANYIALGTAGYVGLDGASPSYMEITSSAVNIYTANVQRTITDGSSFRLFSSEGLSLGDGTHLWSTCYARNLSGVASSVWAVPTVTPAGTLGYLNNAQTISAAGATAITTGNRTTRTLGGTAGNDITSTMGDGFAGQVKKLVMETITAVKTWIVTPTNFQNGTTITFAVAGDWIELEWSGVIGKWFRIASAGAVIA